MADTTRRGTPVRDFHDAGTGERFEQGKAVDFEAGAYGNYLAAGLLSDADGAPAPAPTQPVTKPA